MAKKYGIPESPADMAAEPTPKYGAQALEADYAAEIALIEGDDVDWDYDREVPFGNSLDDVRTHLQEAIDHLDDPAYWKPWEESMAQLRAKYAAWLD